MSVRLTETQLIERNCIRYCLKRDGDMMFERDTKPEIMFEAFKRGMLKDSFKDPNDFITVPHLKDGITIHFRQTKSQWVAISKSGELL